MMINSIHTRGEQSERAVCMKLSQPFCIYCNTHLLLRAIPSFHVKFEWPSYKVINGQTAKECNKKVHESSSIGLRIIVGCQ